MRQQGFFVWRYGEDRVISENQDRWIKARLKTHREIIWVFREAVYWGRPNDSGFRSADEVILPFLGKEVWVRKVRCCMSEFHYEIKDTGGFVALPNWIESFDSEDLIPPAKWKRDPEDKRVDDIWLDRFEDRSFLVGDTLIIHG